MKKNAKTENSRQLLIDDTGSDSQSKEQTEKGIVQTAKRAA
jgi:hypothetical protein